jgi:hypothetical protein
MLVRMVAAARRILDDDLLRLLLGGHEQHVAATPHRAPDRVPGLLDALERLLQVDDVDAVALHEDEALHLRVPASRLMPEVHASFEQVLHRDIGHGPPPSGFVPPPRSGAKRRHRRNFAGPKASDGACVVDCDSD